MNYYPQVDDLEVAILSKKEDITMTAEQAPAAKQ